MKIGDTRICAACDAIFAATTWNATVCTACYAKGLIGKAVCEGCGQTFPKRRRSARDANRFCSKNCPGRNSEWTHWWFHRCEACNTLFIGHRNARLCSDECRAEDDRRRERERYHSTKRVAVVECICPECGERFKQESITGLRQVYCSTGCAYRVGKRTRRARARTNTVHPETIYFHDVWDRSNGKCHVCGEWMDRNIEHPHPLAATIDHVIPIARGGAHTLGNLRLAHHCCNSIKSDREEFDEIRERALHVVTMAAANTLSSVQSAA